MEKSKGTFKRFGGGSGWVREEQWKPNPSGLGGCERVDLRSVFNGGSAPRRQLANARCTRRPPVQPSSDAGERSR